ncbi:hypothetical protein RhiJN_15961 [Ceratobasidium sp. AG-Ba]|nr:hypothetical protein RhiJN_15961 [Ceratobasidium sp. AG-Ba]
MSVITPGEFARYLNACKPPNGWGKSIIDPPAVALSGGPDSLCLLQLLRKHAVASPSLVRMLRSITIDHGLQLTSRASAQRTHARALAMGVPNVILPAAWDTNPTLGSTKTAIEESARKARYKALWAGLWKDCSLEETQTLMFAHHADDQLETVIMRTMRGTNTYGMGGMRSVRRWGITEQGMRTWICRPLLGVSKERILATCEADNIEYEQDVTNFMPDLTVRNAIRHALSRLEQPPADENIRRAIVRIRALAGGVGGIEDMRAYVGRMADRVVRVDQEVDSYIRTHTRRSPPSTFLLVRPDPPTSLPSDVQVALIHRILRYVSPHPWGSPESEAGRRSESIERIAQHAFRSTENIQPFTAGAQVLWTPVAIRPDGSIRRRTDKLNQGWLASRQPPLARAKSALTVEASPGTELLWDNRFLVRIPARENQCRVLIKPQGRLVLPEIVKVLKNGTHKQTECETRFVRTLDAI